MAAPVPILTPTNYSEYRRWLSEAMNYDLARGEREFNVIQNALHDGLAVSSLWNEIKNILGDLAQSYYIKTGLELFSSTDKPTLEINKKTYESYLQKAFRYSFVKDPPIRGPSGDCPVPSFFYDRIDDLLRTLLVVRFLDGVEYLINHFEATCNSRGRKGRVEYKCNEEGYFAAHYYFSIPVRAVLGDGDLFSKEMLFEIQITTQLQEVLRRFLHFQYEKDRMQTKQANVPWQWRYRENEFFSNYLGHMLRNVEGQIMDARRRRNIADACTK